jgi:hypothetical protein
LRRLEVKVYNHQFQNRGVLARIRRKLERSVTQGECVLLDGEGVEGLSPQDLYALIAGLSGRTRIKQKFVASDNPIAPWYPPKWEINDLINKDTHHASI